MSAVLVILASATMMSAQSGQSPTRDQRAAADKPPASGLLAGTVVAFDTAQPLPGVRVVLSSMTAPVTKSAITDLQGQFSFDQLDAGTYRLSASRAGYVDSVWGQKQPGSGRPGTSLQLGNGAPEQIKNLSLPIAKGGVITGLITDEFGYPSTNTTVRVYRSVFRNGERALQQSGTGQSDDRGIYRVFGLTPGEYVVIASPRLPSGGSAAELVRREAEVAVAAGERYTVVMERITGLERASAVLGSGSTAAVVEPSAGYAPVFYPGTTTAATAARVAVGVSEEKAGIDIRLQIVPLSSISGVVTGMSPLPAALTVYLTEQGPLPGIGTKTARVAPDGRFSIGSVPPGQYMLTARAALRPAVPVVPIVKDGAQIRSVEAQPSQWMWAQTELTVSGQPLGDVALVLAPGMSISGTVAFRGSAPAPTDLTRVRLSFLPMGQSAAAAEMELASASGRVDAQGRFTAVGLMPGRYRVTASAPGWSLSSMTAQGREALDFPIEVTSEDVTGVVATFTDRQTTLSGTLQGADGRPAPDYTVVVFASDSRFWTPASRRISAARPASDGKYLFNLPPGDYRIAAVVDPEPGQWFDPEFLTALVAASTTVTLVEGDSRVQDLRIGR